jgi:hypothetical protein
MASKRDSDGPNAKRELSGVLAATLGLVAIACGGDDDESMSPAGGGSAGEGGQNGAAGKGSTTAGKSGSMTGDGGMPTTGEGGSAQTSPDADIEPLNALLAAEYNAITAYSAGAGLIGDAPDTDPLYGLADVIIKIAVDIQAQHKLHAAALVEAIEALGGVPIEEDGVAAAFMAPEALSMNPTISNVLKFAASAERAAAIAYNQVLAGLEDAKHRFIAASIEGDETQHFIVLAALVLGLADPGENLGLETAEDVVPEAFVSSVGDVGGLDTAPPDYFA